MSNYQITFEEFNKHLEEFPKLHSVSYCMNDGPDKFKPWAKNKFKPGKAKTVFFSSKNHRKPILEMHFETTQEKEGAPINPEYFLIF